MFLHPVRVRMFPTVLLYGSFQVVPGTRKIANIPKTTRQRAPRLFHSNENNALKCMLKPYSFYFQITLAEVGVKEHQI